MIELLPAMLLIFAGLFIAVEVLGLRERLRRSAQLMVQREEALHEVCLAWRQNGGFAAVAGRSATDGDWVVVVLPSVAWLPDQVSGQHIGLAAQTPVSLWRRTEVSRNGCNGWLIEERSTASGEPWQERLWIRQ